MNKEHCQKGMHKGECGNKGNGCVRHRGQQGNHCKKGPGNCNGEGRKRHQGNCCKKDQHCE